MRGAYKARSADYIPHVRLPERQLRELAANGEKIDLLLAGYTCRAALSAPSTNPFPYEAHLPAEDAQAFTCPWFSCPDAYECWALDTQAPPRQGPQAPVRVIVGASARDTPGRVR